jgi:hypothetical protein
VYDGRLQQLEGFGPKRVDDIRVSLVGMLNRSAQRTRRQATGETKPTVELLLDVDKAYRRKAAAGKLRKIAPKYFNFGWWEK